VRGRLIVVSGPSGAGKSTLIKASLEAVPELAYSVSATTRGPRPGEVDGMDYIFLSRREFERWIQEGRFLEWAEYSGNLYGTPERKVEEFLDEGKSVILELELQGARQVQLKRPDAVMVFVRAPSLEETRRRLTGRATESEEALESRLATAVGGGRGQGRVRSRDHKREPGAGPQGHYREDGVDSKRRQRCCTTLR
jgi:guanylate kinase